MTKPRILIMAGGTGGHIFPAQAVALALDAVGWQIHWLGSSTRMEATRLYELKTKKRKTHTRAQR